MTQGERYGDVATRLLFENDRVKIWEMRLEPGEDGALHRHELDHILVQVSGDRMAVVPHPDSQSVYSEYLEGLSPPRVIGGGARAVLGTRRSP